MSGIGVLWFLHELLLCEVVLVLIRKLDKKDRLWQLGGKANFPVICLLVLGMWGSAYILNTPVIEVYRNGFYLFCFLAGYILFSHEQIQSLLAKWAPCMLAVSGVLAVVYTMHFWGQNYAALNNLKAPLTNLYAWFACLGVLGAGKRWLDKETAFTRCMASRASASTSCTTPCWCCWLGRWISCSISPCGACICFCRCCWRCSCRR